MSYYASLGKILNNDPSVTQIYNATSYPNNLNLIGNENGGFDIGDYIILVLSTAGVNCGESDYNNQLFNINISGCRKIMSSNNSTSSISYWDTARWRAGCVNYGIYIGQIMTLSITISISAQTSGGASTMIFKISAK